MKKIVLLVFVALFLYGFTGGNQLVIEDISVSFGDIAFSKSVNNGKAFCKIENERISIEGVKGTNYFNAPDESRFEATAPILLTSVNNEESFTFTTKMQCKLETTYDAGTVYIYIHNNNWLKFAFELDEKNRKRVVTVRTDQTSDDNNHDIIDQDYIYLKISSNVKQLGFYYSLDGMDWNLVRLFKNDYPDNIWIGISSQSPKGSGVITYFENVKLVRENVKNFRLGN